MTKNIIPTINISPILKYGFNSFKSLKTINKIKGACIKIGFFQITGHGISQKNIRNICKVGSKFFNSSKKNKIKNRANNYCSNIKSKRLSINIIFI